MPKKPAPFVSRIPDLTFPPPLPGMRDRIEASVMAINLLELIQKCRAGQYNEEVRYRANLCLEHEIAALERHRSNIVYA